MELSWHQASKDLSHFVTGFVERRDVVRAGASIELPLAVPLLHLTLGATYAFKEEGVSAPIRSRSRRGRASFSASSVSSRSWKGPIRGSGCTDR